MSIYFIRFVVYIVIFVVLIDIFEEALLCIMLCADAQDDIFKAAGRSVNYPFLGQERLVKVHLIIS